MELEECIKDATDVSMQDYIYSEHYRNQRQHVRLLLTDIRDGLSPEKSKALNELLNAISICDGEYAAEAYLRGVVDGTALRDKRAEI